MKAGVILSGSGVYDGSEIHEAVFSLLAIEEANMEAVCAAPNIDQFHVINHIDGTEMDETRNVMIESARIARGNIIDLKDLKAEDIDILVIPGGFGAAKNLNQWAVRGPDGEINKDVVRVINEMHNAGKPICGLCMGPTVISQALYQAGVKAKLTVGTTEEASPYDIAGISKGMESIGTEVVMKTVRDVQIDEDNKIVTAPCYMMEATIKEIRDNIKSAITATVDLIN